MVNKTFIGIASQKKKSFVISYSRKHYKYLSLYLDSSQPQIMTHS